jgi:hypothetical protein
MFEQARSFFPDIVEVMLPRFSGKLALKFRVKLSLDYFGKEEDIQNGTAKELHDTYYVEYLVVRPYNYTKVYMRQGEDTRSKTPQTWRFVADHDSCWKEAFEKMSHIYFDRRQKFLDAGLEWHQISEHFCFDLFSGKPHYILLEKAEPVEEVARNDHWKLRQVEHKLTFGGRIIPLEEIHKYLHQQKRQEII